MALIDQTKTVIESMQNLMVAAKEAGGNRKVRIVNLFGHWVVANGWCFYHGC